MQHWRKNNDALGTTNRGEPCESGLCTLCDSDCKGKCETWRSGVQGRKRLDPKNFGKRIGQQLYEALIALLREQDFHSVIGVITLPNEPSIQLHEKFGFKKVGHFTEVGKKFGKWMDVGFWELVLT